jgi:ribosomal protein L35AE/L33A
VAADATEGKGGPGVAGDDGGGGCAAKVAWAAVVRCKGGRGAVVVRMEAGTRARGTSEWWGR